MDLMIKAVAMSAMVSAVFAVGCSGAEPSTSSSDESSASGNEATEASDTATDNAVTPAALGGCYPIISKLTSAAAPTSAAAAGVATDGKALFAKGIQLRPLATQVVASAADFPAALDEETEIQLNPTQGGAQAISAGAVLDLLLPDFTIVGLWNAKTVDAAGNLVSRAFKTWHSDYTEFQVDTNSPIAGNTCSGTWIPLGRRSFGLTHPFYAFDPATGQPSGASGIMYERVTVSPNGDTYTGRLRVKVVLGQDPLDPAAYVLFDAAGATTSATRVEVDRSQLP